MDPVSRAQQLLLQQGYFVADVVYYYGQDSNITAILVIIFRRS